MFRHLAHCKWIGSFLLVVGALFCNNAMADPVLDKVLSTHSIKLAWVDGNKPLSWELNGKPTGMAIDLCLDVVDSIKKRYNAKIDVQWVQVSSAARFEYIIHHQADVLCAIAGITSQRSKTVNFSTPWFYTQTNLLAKKSENINNKEMLAGRTVGAISGGTSALLLSKVNQELNYSVSVKLVRSFDEGFKLLKDGHISAFVTDDIIIRSKLAEIPDRDDYEMGTEALGDELSYGLAVAKDADDMLNIINTEIKSIFISNKFDVLYNKWFMSPITSSGENIRQPMSERLIEQKNSFLSVGNNAPDANQTSATPQ